MNMILFILVSRVVSHQLCFPEVWILIDGLGHELGRDFACESRQDSGVATTNLVTFWVGILMDTYYKCYCLCVDHLLRVYCMAMS